MKKIKICDFEYINFSNTYHKLTDKIEEFYIVNDKLKVLKHVKLVSQTNIIIANQYGLNVEKCYLSALLHDVSAVIKPNDMLDYAVEHNYKLDDAEIKYPFLLHQQISRLFAEEIFDIKDTDILSAIACHTTLKSNPNKYDLSLFIADKLSWDQEGQPPFFSIVSEAMLISLEKAALQYIDYMLANNMILYPHKWFLDAKKYLNSIDHTK